MLRYCDCGSEPAMTHNIPSPYGGFAYGWSTLPNKTIEYRFVRGTNPDSEQMKPAERQLGGDTL